MAGDGGAEGNGLVLDCDEGRRRGCATFCCRLIVRLKPGERDPGGGGPEKHCLDKRLDDGLCVYYDRQRHLCTVWERRPQACREFDCNRSSLLGVVLRDGFRSLIELVTAEPARGGQPVPRIPGKDEPADD